MKQLIDIKWKWLSDLKYQPVIKLRDTESLDLQSLPLIPSQEGKYFLKFKLSQNKYCVGYFTANDFKSCPNKNILKNNTATQCPTCERLQGFKSAFLFNEEPNENMKEYLAQKHFIYLAFFSPNIIKVGTASEVRANLRPIEQDALVYCYIAESDGFNIQKLEHQISKQLGITETVKSAHKLKNLSSKIKFENAQELLMSKYDLILKAFKDTEFKDWIYKKENLNIVDLSNLPEIFYPEKEVFFQKNELHLFGEYKGLRGRFLIIENDENYFGFDIKFLIGRMIDSYIDDWKYNLNMVQIGLGI